MLLMISSCAAAVIKEPQPVYIINTKFMAVTKGTKNFNINHGRDEMTSWIQRPVLINWSDMPENLIAFPVEIWLTKVKPALKALSSQYSNKAN